MKRKSGFRRLSRFWPTGQRAEAHLESNTTLIGAASVSLLVLILVFCATGITANQNLEIQNLLVRGGREVVSFVFPGYSQ